MANVKIRCYNDIAKGERFVNTMLELAINKLGHDWYHLNWEFRDVVINGAADKMSQWQGDPEEDIMVVVFKGSHIEEPFHRQDFFFIYSSL